MIFLNEKTAVDALRMLERLDFLIVEEIASWQRKRMVSVMLRDEVIKESQAYLNRIREVKYHVQQAFDFVDTFDEAFKRTGYQYGRDELEQVRLGWQLARGEWKK